MSRKIIGITVGTQLPKPNFKQTDPTKGDYIKNKPDFEGLQNEVSTISGLVGETPVSQQIDEAIANKVDKVDGKSLSTNDFTNAEKEKLAGIESYIEEQINSIECSVESVNGKTGDVNLTAADVGALPNTTVIPSIEGLATEEYVDNAIAEMPTPDVSGQINTHNTASDAHTDIRSAIPTKVSDLTNDSGYLTEHQSLAGYAKTSDLTSHNSSASAHQDIRNAIPNVPSWAMASTRPTYTASDVGAEASGAVSTHNTNTSAHNDIRVLIEDLTTRLNTLADSDDTTLDQMSEIVAYIKSNKSLIEDITTNKVNVSDIINNLTTNVTNKPLSAAQGVALKGLIDGLDSDKLDASSLTSAINTALSQAKTSGEFDGKDGEDGVSPTHSWSGTTLTITSASGSSSANLKGSDGVGISKVQQTTTSTADDGNNIITVTLSNGTTSTFTVQNGSKGSKGDSPVRGTDYWTDADKAEIKSYVDEAILGGEW